MQKASKHQFSSCSPLSPFASLSLRALISGSEPSASNVCSPSMEELTGGLYQATRRQIAGEIRISQTAAHLSPTPAARCSVAVRARFLQLPGATCSPDCSRSASCFPDSLLLLGDRSKLSCRYFLFTFSLFQLSGLSVPKFSFPKMLGAFLLEPCGVAKTWPHLSPAAQTSPPRPTCKGQSVLLLQEPSRSPRVIVSLLARTQRLVLSTLWESTCGKGVKSTFLQLSSEKRGSQARIWAAGGCFITGG